MITFDEFKLIYESAPGEPEFEIYFYDKEKSYMIIKYNNCVSFQRCGITDGSGEIYYPNLTVLYNTELIDGICLCDCWDDIETIIFNSTFDLGTDDGIDDIKYVYGIEL